MEIVHRGKFKLLTKRQRRWLKRRQAIEPVIGHLKSDNRMDRCWLQGSIGDALHTVLCAVGYNLRWLLMVLVRLGLAAVLFALNLWLAMLAGIAPRTPNASAKAESVRLHSLPTQMDRAIALFQMMGSA